MNVFRCVALSVVVLLSACDAQDSAAPKPKVSAEAQAPAKTTVSPPVAESAKPAPEPAKTQVHDLAPNVSVVPVKTNVDAAPVSKQNKAEAAKAPAKTAKEKKREAVTRKSVAESKKALKDTSLNNAKLDLSLPPELAEELKPAGTTQAKPRKPILPQMFGDKRASGNDPFELNGRILSNEMDLQMRNDSRRDVEGAALDFKFRQ
ncbi:translation initiation factor 2 [Pseudomonas folii]|uniref:Translation initiation factor 2 n=1 Tax=Pseudomonas folii TaxID=2762593 RepID=A0ABR7B606_9PSED|nr:translation initiation factor 2 [Pseudomonas folii]MBC3952618.1 translation initiation factor 2 [Pseudomonas folii]